MYKSIFILGRLPAIGRAELESLFGADHIESIGERAVGCDIDPSEIDFARTGSSVRLAKPLTVLHTTKWADVVRYVTAELPRHLDFLPEGKIKLGLSVFGMQISPNNLLRTGLELKKTCKAAGRTARVVPPSEGSELNSAQVLHNQLTGKLGMELLFIHSGNNMWLAQTRGIQDITAYAQRDQNRPKRDAFVGMLPPKLAQTIVNLGTGQLPPHDTNVVLDPFCGTGVVLQEALLMGYGAYGTDLKPRMIDYTRQNLQWLASYGVHGNETLEAGDATTHQWGHPFSAIASETYLGRPLISWPGPDKLHEIIGTCNVIIEKFLNNLASQLPANTRLCLAVPGWHNPNGHIHHLPLLDHLEKMGYNRISFEHAKTEDLVYFRPDQLVARELLVMIKK